LRYRQRIAAKLWLDAYALKDAKWTPLGVFRDDDAVSVAPFDAIVIRLADLWG
jgi:hypothetical protein